jgi:hypothetical protein
MEFPDPRYRWTDWNNTTRTNVQPFFFTFRKMAPENKLLGARCMREGIYSVVDTTQYLAGF